MVLDPVNTHIDVILCSDFEQLLGQVVLKRIAAFHIVDLAAGDDVDGVTVKFKFAVAGSEIPPPRLCPQQSVPAEILQGIFQNHTFQAALFH